MQFTRKVMALTLTMGLIALTGCAVIIPNLVRAEEDFSFNQPEEGVGTLVVDWRVGSITIRVDDSAEQITVTGTKIVRAASESIADDILADIDISWSTLESDPAQATLALDVPTSLTYSYSVDVEVVLPASLPVTVSAVAGEVLVRGLADQAVINVEAGDITLEDHAGDAIITADLGDVDITSTGGDVDVELETGDVTVAAAPAAGGAVIVDVEIGTANVQVPADFGATLKLATDLGSIDADLSAFTVSDLVDESGELTATLNDGGGEIDISTQWGGIEFAEL